MYRKMEDDIVNKNKFIDVIVKITMCNKNQR